MAAVDDRLLTHGLQRLTNHGLSWPIFLVRKLDRAWSDASAGLGFAFQPDSPRLAPQRPTPRGLSLAADAQWVLLLVGALLWYWRRRDDPGLEGTIVAAITSAIVVGTLLLEAQPRYHEYVVPLFVGLAATELARLARLREPAAVRAPTASQESGTPIRA
jgi:hypothetical protein